MSAKKKAKPKNTIDMEKLAEEVRTKIRKKVDKEKPANKEVSTSKELPQRACIDCHFLVEKQDDTEEAGLEPHEMDPRITYYCVEANKREPIRSNDYSWIKFPLVCYRGCWTEVYDKEKQHEEVVEKDRRDCPLAYPYTEGMSFDAAKEMQERMLMLQANQNNVQSNKTEPLATQQSRDYEFFLKGEFWTISYEGKTTHLRDSRGLQYIHCLLENPEEEFYTLELVHKIKISPPFKNIYEFLSKEERVKQLIKESVYKGLTKNTGYVLDKKGIQSLKERYEDLESELEDEQTPPNDERTSEIEMDMDEIKKTLSAGHDKLGRPRKFPNDAEKARKAISKAVKESLDKIKDENNGHRSLWKHFEITLTIGIFCSYKPEKPIPWHL